MIIYKITNKINGKIYIGQTIRSLNKRWNLHCSTNGSCAALHNAIRKYGKETFTIEEIGSYKTLEDLNNAEEYYIDWYNCLSPDGYNLLRGGNNRTPSLETRLKLSKSTKGRKASETTLAKLRLLKKNNKNNLGKKFSNEHKLKMSLAKKGKLFTKEHRKNLSLSHKGKKHSVETKLKMSISHKNRKSKEKIND